MIDSRNVLDELRSEHRVLLDVVGRLEAAVGGEGPVPSEFLRAGIGFLRSYADANHHGKEEKALFAVMLGDEFLAAIAEQLGSEHETARALITAIDYAWLIRDHIRREDEMVFDAAEARLGQRAREKLRDEFRRIQDEGLGDGGAEALLDGLVRAEALA